MLVSAPIERWQVLQPALQPVPGYSTANYNTYSTVQYSTVQYSTAAVPGHGVEREGSSGHNHRGGGGVRDGAGTSGQTKFIIVCEADLEVLMLYVC